ncbi:protein-glutamate methylesterase/protein-glutamine glutaminase [Cognatilysobacter bugurensis]|uniref:Protein-glutamate methylesterase/protein-glutamine glutaminase n=1 Tax=Cognatilysobacter bugurensis TaxID=543356 RepID=A0A918WA89_9GAMM|nr:chemotaxis response regulator protein-glutamate methylesterase [Lysobacter bugurensis]GHA84441.1 chemotaxis response regulator protein-glutamate methylesterase of group 1 operon [Lysobacter bugurensis]
MNTVTAPASRKIRVLVVDDSPLLRRLITELLEADPAIEVVGTAADPFIARDKIKQLSPDVLTLDIEMPRMDGITFLRNLMRLRPMPVVMVSTLTQAGAQATLDALAAGAVDFVPKPCAHPTNGLGEYGVMLVEKVKAAATAQVAALSDAPAPAAPAPAAATYRNERRVIAIGASTGGTEAIRMVLETFPADAPPTVIVQHIPATFSGAFAQRLDRSTRLTVHEAQDGDALQIGHAYVAPGGRHLRIERHGRGWRCRIGDDLPVRLHRPSVDVMFDSLVESAKGMVSAALLTGMGDDGARGLCALRKIGAPTFAQDQASSVVWGMPGAAVALGGAGEVLPLGRVGTALLSSTLEPVAA